MGAHYRGRVSLQEGQSQQLRCKTFAALGAATSDNDTTVFGGHAGAEAVTASPNQFARLKSTFHEEYPQI